MPAAAPSGQVTLVFTDLQGSTELWEKLGARFQPVLERHHAILRERLAAREGFEVKTEGDAFMIAFARASDAIRFTLETQEALSGHAWPAETGELRVRMGVHTGEPLCITDSATGRPDYYGPAVNRAARIAAAAHGGQVLVSGVTLELAAEARDTALATDLGEHRLKGLERPERIWQVAPRALAGRTFPPLKTLSALPTNLPVPATSFIGRDRELRELTDLFEIPATRLVTLTGPGGTGKTRLALRFGADVLDHVEGGVWFADLSEERSGSGVAEAVARALGVPISEGEAPAERVAAALALRRPLLLVLDNFEQVVEAAAATVGVWRRRAPEARFLVTSRSLLGIAGEREFEVPPLGVPSAAHDSGVTARVEAYDGVRLFLERAREADARFRVESATLPAVAELCLKLDGIPLAIELAAARMKVLKPAEMLARLDQRFQVLRSTRRDLPPRQQTLLGAIDWSYELLAPWERVALQQICVFHGGFFLDDAEAVLQLPPEAPDVITAVQMLREKSLLRSWQTTFGPRLGLYLSIQEYGRQKWRESTTAEEREAMNVRHAAQSLKRPEAAQRERLEFSGRDAALLELDVQNIRAAHQWAVETRQGTWACRAAVAVAPLLHFRGAHKDLAGLLEAALSIGGPAEAVRVEAAMFLTQEYSWTGDSKSALAAAGMAEGWAAEIGDRVQRARLLLNRHSLGGGPAEESGALAELRAAERVLEEAGWLSDALRVEVAISRLIRRRDAREALAVLNQAEALALRCKERFAILPLISERVLVFDLLGDVGAGLKDLDRIEPLIREREDLPGLANWLRARGRLLGFEGRHEEAMAMLTEAEQILRKTGSRPALAMCLGAQAGELLRSSATWDESGQKIDEAERLAREIQAVSYVSTILNLKALRQIRLGKFVEAEKFLLEAISLAISVEGPGGIGCAQANSFLADLRIAQARWAEALGPISEAVDRYEAAGQRRLVAPSRIARGLVLLELGRAGEAVTEAERGIVGLREMGIEDSEVGIRGRIYLGRARAASGDLAGARELLVRTRKEVDGIGMQKAEWGEALRPLLAKLESAVGGSA
ncbi:MAG: adenylate/guanylate cyclase domain-containing protein [Planctomycetota bacterium]